MSESASHIVPDLISEEKAVISTYLVIERGGILELEILVPFF
jgi:hypothetical protein